ncbi:MAG: ABC transporter ATP-binding protein [Gammaproteobacteria bacterium]|nr:ABC transporter ATP-binding protein [Gammaproteobacteria bacterium]
MASTSFNIFDTLKTKSVMEVFALIPRVIRFMWQSAPLLLAATGVLRVVEAITPAVTFWFMKVIVDRVVESLGSEVDWFYVLLPILIVTAVRLGNSLLSQLNNIWSHILTERVYSSAHASLLDKAASLDVAFFEAPQFYDRLAQARRNVWRIQNVVEGVPRFLQQFLSLAAIFGLLSILHPLAIVLLIVTTLPRIYYEGFTARKRFDMETEMIRNYRSSDYYGDLPTQREKIKEIRIFGLKQFIIERFRKYRDIVVRTIIRLNIRFLKLDLTINNLPTIGIALVWAYAVYRTAKGGLTVGDLTMIVGAAQSAVSTLQGLISSGGYLFESTLFVTRFFELLDLDPKSIEGSLQPPRARKLIKVPSPIRRGIRLRNVTFKYPGTDTDILKGVSFSIPAGTKLAIVGENGAGKTTLIKLLVRFYDPISGSIELDGTDFRDYELQDIRRNISAVFQDFVRYQISASDNIGVGNVEQLNHRDVIEDASKKAGSHEFVSKLPKEYDTILGKTFDEGVDLSGGEWQNLAIARAFMSESQILFLDEPTAALDAFGEAALYDRFARLSENKTVVFISHRFSTVRMADTIVVVEDGRIIEQGSHEELLDIDGKYRLMFNTQAERYA